MDPQKRMTVLVSGEVQGVGYRAFAKHQASDLDLHGYAENLGDGRVEVVAEGDEEDLKYLLHLLERGPTHAEVQSLDVSWAEVTGLEGFYVY